MKRNWLKWNEFISFLRSHSYLGEYIAIHIGINAMTFSDIIFLNWYLKSKSIGRFVDANIIMEVSAQSKVVFNYLPNQ
jgi:hypothetical protein